MTGAAMRDTSIQGASLEVHPESGTILAVDPVLEELLGFRPGELIGRHVSTLAREDALRPKRGLDPFVELFSDATHDLIGPLNQASALVTLLARKLSGQAPDPDVESIIGFISNSVKRMESLTGSLKLYSKVLGSPAVLRDTDLNGLFPAVLANFARAMDAGELEVECAPLPVVACDATQILFLLQHLIENAWKFRRDGKASVEIACSRRGDDHVFSVRDNGIGFEPRHSEQIFRMFKRLEGDRYPGTGAGLTICRQIVVRHNGGIWAESAAGRGTTIWFTLPSAG